MTEREKDQTFKLGREVVRMIHDVSKAANQDTGYARRTFSFPGGSVELLVVNDRALADLFDQAAAAFYNVSEEVPPSTKN